MYCGIIVPATAKLALWMQIAHQQLVNNELTIHSLVDATVPYIVKSEPGVYGSVEGAGDGWAFLKLQRLGRNLSSFPAHRLPQYWSCAFQVR